MEKQEVYNSILMFRFKELHRLMYNKANKMFCKTGMPISVEQLPVLMTLYYRGKLSQQEIADLLDRDKSSVLRSIKSLEIKELIIVAQDPFDKRKKMIQLTKEGNGLGVNINNKIMEIDQAIFSCLNSEEKKVLEKMLMRCSEGIRDI